MKRIIVLIILAAAAMLFTGLDIYAQEGMPTTLFLSQPMPGNRSSAQFVQFINADNANVKQDLFSEKLGNGVINLATCWTDVPRRMETVARERSAFEGYTVGMGEGILQGIVRGIAGTYDTTTSIVPPFNKKPVMEAEYSVKHPQKDGLKLTLLQW